MLTIKNGEFVDEHDRTFNLRGINLGGSSKIPSTTNWLDSKTTTFVNRPFPISEAPLHFRRIRACGYTIIRFIVTWEAIEHDGPGVYDYEYIEYVKTILQMASEYNLQIYIDPHQDVWSRWTGGDGAPLWTLLKVGFDISNFRKCEAAICQETYGQGHSTAEQRNKDKEKKSLPKMIWPTNYFKLGAATMFTLFWPGERFAPNFIVDSGDGNDSKKVNIETTPDGPTVTRVADESRLQGHLMPGNRIVAINGIDTKNAPAELVIFMLTSTTTPTHNVTVLQFSNDV